MSDVRWCLAGSYHLDRHWYIDHSMILWNLEISHPVPMCMSSAFAEHVQLLQGTLKTVCSPESCLSWNISEIAPDPFRLAVEPSLLLWFLSLLSFFKKIKSGKCYKIRPTILEHYWSQGQGADPRSFDLSRTVLAEMDHPKCEKAPDSQGPRPKEKGENMCMCVCVCVSTTDCSLRKTYTMRIYCVYIIFDTYIYIYTHCV